MKKITYMLLLVLMMAPVPKARSQVQELKQLALNIEKLSQFRAILKDMKKGYEILSQGYNTVKDLTEGNFDLHKTFLDGLLQVSPSVRNYRRIGDIIGFQVQIVQGYSRHRTRLQGSGLFNSAELSYFSGVYEGLLAESLRDIDALTAVLTAGAARMSDDERLAEIDRIYSSMQEKMLFLNDFNSQATIQALQRAKESHDIKAIRILIGTNN